MSSNKITKLRFDSSFLGQSRYQQNPHTTDLVNDKAIFNALVDNVNKHLEENQCHNTGPHALQSETRRVELTIDETSGEMSMRVENQVGETERELNHDEVHDILEEISELRGLIFNKKV